MSFLGPSRTELCSQLHTPFSHPRQHTMLPSIVRRAWPAAHVTSLRPPRRSLQRNDLTDEAKRVVKDAAGSVVSITFEVN